MLRTEADKRVHELLRAGFDVAYWCGAVGISRATYYNLPEALKPLSVKIGKRRIIREQPVDYLRRIAEDPR